MKDKTVYILGAGCSAFKDGYPLATDFCDTLKGYRITLDQKSNCERLKQSVTNTIGLLEEHQSPTVDRLVLQIVEDGVRQRGLLGPIVTQKHHDLERTEDNQIRDAKIATSALILQGEEKARKTGLHRYRDFLYTIFEGDRRPSVLETSSKRVLSFNYDRLFEIAFAHYFRLDDNRASECYGQAWLNSGLNVFHHQTASIDFARFCFLKMHGTAGMGVRETNSKCTYGWQPLSLGNRIIDDELFWPVDQTPSRFLRENPEPLIVFPCEKDRARSDSTSFVFDNYIREIWGKGNEPGNAQTVVEQAERIYVIGYSFDASDRKAMLSLIRKSDCEICVRSRSKEGAEAICEKLRDHGDVASRLRPSGNPF